MQKNLSLRKKRTARKTILRLQDLDHAEAAVLNSLTCPDAQRVYRHAIDGFIAWYCSEPRLSFNKTVVLRYRIHLEFRKLAPGTISLQLGAVRRLAYEAADCGLLSPDLAAGIRRVKGVKKIGVRQKSRHRQAGATRSSENLCPAVPYGGRRIETDSVSVGPCFGANDRAIPGMQTAHPACGQRSHRY